jgi:hypothetical protein
VKYKTGDIIKVKVGGVEYDTIIDHNNVQCFKCNSVIDYLLMTQRLNLNQLAMDYQMKKFSQRDYAEFNMMLGYSVSGFRELSSFEDMEIENPLWEK